MKVILQQDVKGQGKKGQLIEVSDGFARNFLLPRGLAVEASAANVNVLNTQQAAKAHHMEAERQKAEALAKALSTISLRISVKAGEGGRLFGSVTAKEIAQELKTSHGIDIDKRKIELDAPIKAYGSYEVPVRLYPEIVAKLSVTVGE